MTKQWFPAHSCWNTVYMEWLSVTWEGRRRCSSLFLYLWQTQQSHVCFLLISAKALPALPSSWDDWSLDGSDVKTLTNSFTCKVAVFQRNYTYSVEMAWIFSEKILKYLCWELSADELNHLTSKLIDLNAWCIGTMKRIHGRWSATHVVSKKHNFIYQINIDTACHHPLCMWRSSIYPSVHLQYEDLRSCGDLSAVMARVPEKCNQCNGR